MPRVARRILHAALAVALLSVAVLVALVLFLDPAAHKSRIEEAASRALGMEVSVNGPLTLHWAPQPQLVLHDVRARKNGSDIATAKQAVIGLELSSLLGNQPRVHSVALHDGTLAIVRDANGRFNFQKDRVPGQPRPARDLPDVSFAQAVITYADAHSERPIEARGCRGDLRRLHTAGGERRWLAGLSFEGDAVCTEVRSGALQWADVSAVARAQEGVFDFQPVRMQWFDARGSGRLHADFTGAAAAYQLEHTLQQLPVEPLLKSLSLKEVAAGRVNVALKLAFRGGSAADLKQSMTGAVSLRGQGLTYRGGNIDEQFERFESSQTLNLFDVGAMLIAGPAGLLVTKGYDFVSLAQSPQGKSDIRLLVSDWSIERGIARAQDVALATPAHRVAIKGGIDFVNDRYHDMSVALVDANGCAKVQQRVKGTLQKPVVDKPNAIEALAGPAVRLLKKGAELIAGENHCEVFYAGTVPAPSPK